MNTYSLKRRLLHWLIAIAFFSMIALGLWMTARGSANLWDALTDTLYRLHKTLGMCILLLMGWRLALKLRASAMAYPATMSPLLITVARYVHGLLYILLILVPLLGWASVTAYPALDLLGGYQLPKFPFIEPNQALSEKLSAVHGTLALVLAALVALHIGAALKHLLIDKDGIFQRMWPCKR